MEEEVTRINRAVLLFLLSVTLLSVSLVPADSIAEIYRWVDEEGIIHFADDIADVPLKYRPEIISTKPGLKKPETSSRQKDWNVMTQEEKVEYLRRLREKKSEDDRKIAGYPEHIQQLIRDRRLEVGMTKEMVLLSWGNPVDIRPRSPKNLREIWIYSTSGSNKDAYAYFLNDILTEWKE